MYRLMQPHPELSQWIENYWSLTPTAGEEIDLCVDVYVDGRADLVLNFGTPYTRKVFGQKAVEFRTSNLDAQRCDPIQIRQAGQVKIVGVRFKAGGLAPFLRVSADTITNRTPSPSFAFGSQAIETEREINGAIENSHDVTAILDSFFLENLQPTPSVKEFWEMKSEIDERAQNTKIEELCRSLSRVRRSLDRLFAKYLGFSPKYYSRIIRFQAALRCV